jgi:oxygen-independent coproporphyrinogen-3 oxidase
VLVRSGADPRHTFTSVETSPRTADEERLWILREAGVRRVSIGVQSFDERDTKALGRPQKREWVDDALGRIRNVGFPVLNIDLIYGVAGQSPERLLESIDAALAHEPEELYLYPLYVRPFTGLGRKTSLPRSNDERLACYRRARDVLLDRGYEQVSMRFFRRAGLRSSPDTCCQQDGMVGLGCGARSYTRRLHHSFEWAVQSQDIADILRSYVNASDDLFDHAIHGVWLSPEDQQRRYVIKSLLRADGLSLEQYQAFIGSPALDDVPALRELVDSGLAVLHGGVLSLTRRGLELSDAIGPHLYSDAVRALMQEYEPR